ncbi:unnamed protein product [Calicophoron daubneyi]|uniref:Uncharacterized protein n=1 Tax=Calicophoron daubneyi TaxID=300641 RepID=A0AAV2TYC0_CALDB
MIRSRKYTRKNKNHRVVSGNPGRKNVSRNFGQAADRYLSAIHQSDILNCEEFEDLPCSKIRAVLQNSFHLETNCTDKDSTRVDYADARSPKSAFDIVSEYMNHSPPRTGTNETEIRVLREKRNGCASLLKPAQAKPEEESEATPNNASRMSRIPLNQSNSTKRLAKYKRRQTLPLTERNTNTLDVLSASSNLLPNHRRKDNSMDCPASRRPSTRGVKICPVSGILRTSSDRCVKAICGGKPLRRTSSKRLKRLVSTATENVQFGGTCGSLTDVHELINSAALAGLALAENGGQINPSIVSCFTSAVRQSAGTLTSTRCGDSFQDSSRRLLLHGSSRISPHPFKHPFMHVWEDEDEPALCYCWPSKRSAFLAIQSSDCSGISSCFSPSVGVNATSSSSRRLSRSTVDGSRISASDFATSEDYEQRRNALLKLEPGLLGCRWPTDSQLDSEARSKSIRMQLPSRTDSSCEMLVLWC